MMLLAVGCNFRSAAIALRERLAFKDADVPRALEALTVRYGCEAVLLNTCNRVELYLAKPPLPTAAGVFDADLIAEFLGEWHHVRPDELRSHLYQHRDDTAVRHLFRVVASLDSMIVGEGQIAGQVKAAYELAQKQGTAGGMLHALFQHARLVGKRVRTETGIAQGHVSISSAAVVQVRPQLGERQAARLAQELGDQVGVGGECGAGAGQVQLDAVAGAEDHRLAVVADG